MLVRPEKTWYVSELARRMGVPSSSLQRELKDLTAAGILKTHKQGRMVYYQANKESSVFPDLRGLLVKTAGLVDVLADALKPLAGKLRLAFVMDRSPAVTSAVTAISISWCRAPTARRSGFAAAPSARSAWTGNGPHCLFIRRVRQEARDEGSFPGASAGGAAARRLGEWG